MLDKNPDRMRYQSNRAAFLFCILAIVCDVVHLISIYENKVISSDMSIGSDVIINILFLLFVFWASEQCRIYDKNWSYITAGLGVIEILRIFYIPLRFFGKGQLSVASLIFNISILLTGGAALIAAAAITFVRSTILHKHLRKIGARHDIA